MFRTATAAFATTALIAACAASAQAAPQDQVGIPQADPAKIEAAIQSQMAGRAFGWQFAIAQDGKLATFNKGGSALSAADAGGKSVPMQPTMKMELASATKTITAVATMKLLRANGLTIESSVDPYLPPSFQRGPGFKEKKVKFRHLLAHTSGLNQAITAMPDATRPTNNGWDAMRTVVANGTKVDSTRSYKNANYVLLKIINAELWRRSGGQMKTVEEVEIVNSKGIEIGTKEIEVLIPVSKTSYTDYVLDHMRKRIFEPAGLKNIGCTVSDPSTAAKSYPGGATQSTKGQVLWTGYEECAGARGIRLSALDHVQLLAHLRHGAIINPADLAKMDELRLGWWDDAGAASAGTFYHPGDLIGTNQVHTCGATFNDGTEVSLIVNSPIVGTSQCTVVLAAWKAAK